MKSIKESLKFSTPTGFNQFEKITLLNCRNSQHDGTDELSSSDSSGSDSDDGGARGGAGGVNHAQAQLDAAAAASEDSLNSADDIGSNDDGAETFETGQF